MFGGYFDKSCCLTLAETNFRDMDSKATTHLVAKLRSRQIILPPNYVVAKLALYEKIGRSKKSQILYSWRLYLKVLLNKAVFKIW